MNDKISIAELIEQAVKKTVAQIDEEPVTFSFLVTKAGTFATAHYRDGKTSNFAIGEHDFTLHACLGTLLLHYCDSCGQEAAEQNINKMVGLIKKGVHKKGALH